MRLLESQHWVRERTVSRPRSRKHDNERHSDQCVQAGNGNAQVKVGGHIREDYSSAVQSISQPKYTACDQELLYVPRLN
jgi:hypothetical protein